MSPAHKISYRSILSLFCICPTLIPIFLKTEKKSPFSNIFGYKWTRLKLGKDNYNRLYMIKIKKSLFNTRKKDLCTVVHLKRIKTKFVPQHLLEKKREKIIMSQYLLKYNPRKCFSTNYYWLIIIIIIIF